MRGTIIGISLLTVFILINVAGFLIGPSPRSFGWTMMCIMNLMVSIRWTFPMQEKKLNRELIAYPIIGVALCVLIIIYL